MDYQVLDQKAISCWRVGYLIIAAVVTVLLVVLIVCSLRYDWLLSARIWLYGGAALVFAFFLLATVLLPAIEYRQWRYGISDDRIEIRHGIFWLKTIVVPMVRVQHITVSSGPISRHYGLAKLTVHTASGSFEVECLTAETAEALCAMLKERLYIRLRESGES